MYCNFKFMDGSNPYITKTEKELEKMLKKYFCTFLGDNSFYITGKREVNGKPARKDWKGVFQNAAQEWQADFSEGRYPWNYIAEWGEFFQYIGRKYGLLREYRENAII